jgi:hypothetical protein
MPGGSSYTWRRLTSGRARQVAAGLTDASFAPGTCAVRIMLFVGGPTTEGGGQVVDKELTEPIRSHKVGHGVRQDPLLPFLLIPWRRGQWGMEADEHQSV